jgi:hypothetical protein
MNNTAEAESSDQSEKKIFHTIAKGNYPVPATRPYQNRHTIEEEICAKLLNKVKKDVGSIPNEIGDVKKENKKLKIKHGELISEKINLTAEIEDLKLIIKRLKGENVKWTKFQETLLQETCRQDSCQEPCKENPSVITSPRFTCHPLIQKIRKICNLGHSDLLHEIIEDFAKILNNRTLNNKILKDKILNDKIINDKILNVKILNVKIINDKFLNARS